MQVKKAPFLYLIIYILFSLKVQAQQLYLEINGNKEKETIVIDSLSYLRTHGDYQSILAEIDSLRIRLNRSGYIENRLKEIKRINDSSFLAKIHLKQKFDTIYIYYDKSLIDKTILNNISQNVLDDYFELKFNTMEYALNYINSQISEEGLPFSKVKLSNIRIKSGNNLKAELVIDSEQEQRKINSIILKGYEKFPKSYLKHFLKIRKSQIFDLAEIKLKTEKLNNLRFASTIKPPEVLFTKDSTALYLYIEKTKSNNFDGFLGFGTNDETGRLQFDGYLNLNLINNLNYGETFRLLYKSDENDQKTFEANLSLPYLFKTPIGLEFKLNIFKRDSSFTNANQSIKLHYQINSKNKIYSGINTTTSNNLLSEANSLASIADYDATYYNIGYEFLNAQTNNLLFPIHSRINFESNFGKRKTSAIEEDQTYLSLDASKIFNFNLKNSLYLRVNAGSLISDNYFENELLRFGGINSIRGFEENSLYASMYGLLNTEYRYQLSNSIYANTIIDAAYFENKITETEEKLFGFGLGFGLLTKAGLFKFIYANGKSENQKFKFANSKIHVSLVANF